MIKKLKALFQKKPKFVMHNGVRVIDYWVERIEAAQLQETYSISGKEYPRVKYGDEEDDWGADHQPCHDCAVVKGQYHVPSCDVERCPACGGQAISCDCDYDDDED
jgi:hypothetical protein